MKAGRELDALIAEKVMGWERLEKILHPPGPYEMNAWGNMIPHYSTDIDAAWEVVEKMHSMRLQTSIITTEKGVSVTIDEFYCHSPDETIAETAPHAICLAALKALGEEN